MWDNMELLLSSYFGNIFFAIKEFMMCRAATRQSADELQWSEKRDRQSEEARYYEHKIYRHTQNMDQGTNKRLDRKGHLKCFISDVLGSFNTSVVSGC